MAAAGGSLLESTAAPEKKARLGHLASAAGGLAAVGGATGMASLLLLSIKGARGATVAALRSDGVLIAEVEAGRSVGPVEVALREWHPPTAPARVAGPRRDLQRALVRGHLAEARTRWRALAGSEEGALSSGQREAVMQALFEGVGSVLAGDALGGFRRLKEVEADAAREPFLRWLACHWSARAALNGGSLATARAYAKHACTAAEDLDEDARAVSQWAAAEVLALDRESTLALAWLGEARASFEQGGDTWGAAQAWLAEARILATQEHGPESEVAAWQACRADPAWDEPRIFLARRALQLGDLPAAEELLAPLKTPAAERERGLLEAVRSGAVTQADAGAFLRECDRPPSPEALRALQRVAAAAPRFLQAREALAWMQLKLGRYAEAGAIFQALAREPLNPVDRASVMLGLGCVANADKAGKTPETRLRAAVSAASGAPSSAPSASAAAPSPAGSTPPGGSAPVTSVFSGQLSVFALPDLLEVLRGGRRTGLLVLSCAAGVGALRFRKGLVTSAASPSTPSLGQLLARAGKVSPQALEGLVERRDAANADSVLGEQLVREGLADAPSVQAALRQQIALAMREMVDWVDGQFAFDRDSAVEPAGTEIQVEVDPQEVLLNLFKEQDESGRG